MRSEHYVEETGIRSSPCTGQAQPVIDWAGDRGSLRGSHGNTRVRGVRCCVSQSALYRDPARDVYRKQLASVSLCQILGYIGEKFLISNLWDKGK